MTTSILTILSKELYTLKPDGTELLDISASQNKNRIGEYKKAVLEYAIDNTPLPADDVFLNNKVIYFVPELNHLSGSLFPLTNTPPSGAYFSYIVDASATAGTYPMALTCSLPSFPDLIKNWEAEIEIIDAEKFNITLKYFQIYDTRNVLNPTGENNRAKLLKDWRGNVNELDPTPNSIYRNDKLRPSFFVCVQDLTDSSNNLFLNAGLDSYSAGFYNENETGGTAYFTNPVFELLDESNNTASGISTLYDTKIEFRIDSASAPTDLYFWLIKTNTNNNSIDFKDNYKASFCEVINDGSTTTLDNKLKSPSAKLTLDSGTTYTSYLHIDKTKVSIGENYRLIAVVYDTSGVEVNSFISDDITVIVPSFDGVGYDFNARLRDYFTDFYGNNLTCVVEERVQSIIDFGYDYNAFSDDILNRLGLVVTNDIRRYLTKVTVEIYNQPSVQLIQYYDRVTAYKTSPTTYSLPNNMELNFQSNHLEIKYLWRNRYESNVPNIETVLSGIPTIPGNDNQYWGGKSFIIKTTLELFYDDYSTPFTDKIVFSQNITVKDYTTKDLFIYKTGTEIKPSTGEYFCHDSEVCFDAHYIIGTPSDYRLITTIERETGSIATIEENEEMLGVLAQSTTNKIINQETSYSETVANRAKFCVDPTKVVFDEFYKVCAMAKKLIP